MIRIKPDLRRVWKLLGAPAGTKLLRVTITFPSTTSHTGGKTTHNIAGPPKVTIRIERPDGTGETISNVTIEQ
jgi:hypothetical protein